jgi:hypothetical protein
MLRIRVGVGGIAPRIFNLRSRSSWGVGFTSRPLYPMRGNTPLPVCTCYGAGWLLRPSLHTVKQKTKTITKIQCDLQHSADTFYARLLSSSFRIIHTILIMDGGYFCLPQKVAPPCGKSANILDTPVFRHMPDSNRSFWDSHYFKLCA